MSGEKDKGVDIRPKDDCALRWGETVLGVPGSQLPDLGGSLVSWDEKAEQDCRVSVNHTLLFLPAGYSQFIGKDLCLGHRLGIRIHWHFMVSHLALLCSFLDCNHLANENPSWCQACEDHFIEIWALEKTELFPCSIRE